MVGNNCFVIAVMIYEIICTAMVCNYIIIMTVNNKEAAK